MESEITDIVFIRVIHPRGWMIPLLHIAWCVFIQLSSKNSLHTKQNKKQRNKQKENKNRLTFVYRRGEGRYHPISDFFLSGPLERLILSSVERS